MRLPSPFPVQGERPTSAQIHLVDALIAALNTGADDAFASAVTP